MLNYWVIVPFVQFTRSCIVMSLPRNSYTKFLSRELCDFEVFRPQTIPIPRTNSSASSDILFESLGTLGYIQLIDWLDELVDLFDLYTYFRSKPLSGCVGMWCSEVFDQVAMFWCDWCTSRKGNNTINTFANWAIEGRVVRTSLEIMMRWHRNLLVIHGDLVAALWSKITKIWCK